MKKAKSSRGVFPYREGWAIRWRDVDGKDHIRTGFSTERQASNERKRLVGRVLVEQTVPTLLPTLAAYIESHVATLMHKRRRDDALHARTWTEALGQLRLDQVTRPHVAAVKKEWSGILAAATVNRRLAWLSAVLNCAIRDGYDIRDAVPDAGLVRGSDNRRKRELWPDEEDRLEDAFDPDQWPKVLVAIDTGLRQAEQFYLRRPDVDLVNRVITVPHNKPERIKHLYMTDRVHGILTSVLESHDSEWVWIGPKGRRQQVRNWMRDFWAPAVAAAGIEDLCWHDLRHTGASRMRAAGVDLATIKEVLGHSDLRMTERYAHVANTQLQDAARRLQALNDSRKVGPKVGPASGD